MPHHGATLFGDLTGKLDVLRVACDKCGRAGRYRLSCLIDQLGLDGRLPDWLNEIAGDCPKRTSVNWNDRIGFLIACHGESRPSAPQKFRAKSDGENATGSSGFRATDHVRLMSALPRKRTSIATTSASSSTSS